MSKRDREGTVGDIWFTPEDEKAETFSMSIQSNMIDPDKRLWCKQVVGEEDSNILKRGGMRYKPNIVLGNFRLEDFKKLNRYIEQIIKEITIWKTGKQKSVKTHFHDPKSVLNGGDAKDFSEDDEDLDDNDNS
jgi:hypothetical protein